MCVSASLSDVLISLTIIGKSDHVLLRPDVTWQRHLGNKYGHGALRLWSVGHSQVELNFYPYFSHIFFNHIFPMRWHSRFSSGPGPAWSINHWGDNAKYVSRKDDSFTNDHFNELLYRVPANHSSISVHNFPSRPACFICLKSLKALKLSWVNTSPPIIKWYFHHTGKLVIKRCSTFSPGCCDVF